MTTLISCLLLLDPMFTALGVAIVVFIVFIIFVILGFYAAFFKKPIQGEAIVRTGQGGTKIAFDNGISVIPLLHRAEIMEISLKKVEIQRLGKDGLICKDNLRADIKVVFFVRVDRTVEAVTKVSQTIGCERASSPETLVTLFEAKFSEALKTVGKQFEFVELYNSRERFKQEILNTIGKDLNGYVLDDAAIDYLEQTPVSFLKEDNILDSQGIKKITELTANEKIKANLIRNEEKKTITKQDVEAKEAILELERQLTEKEEIQKREIATIKARQEAEAAKVLEEERMKAERARIAAEEEIEIAEQNKQRQVILAEKQKQRVDAIETEKVEKDRLLEVTEREKVVELARIEKQKALEEEKKQIQDVIRERIVVEKTVVEEEEKIKDTKALATAERDKQVALKKAEQTAQQDLIKTTKKAEADKLAAEVRAQKIVIDADAEKNAAVKQAEAKKIMAEARAAEEAAFGVSEAQVIEAKANASERQGLVEANIIEKTAIAEAKAIELKAAANEKQGLAEAKVIEEKGMADAKITEQKGLAEAKILEEKGMADAKGIREKAEAMKQLDGVGKEHEEFKLRLEKEKAIELANIQIQKAVAEVQSKALAEAFKSTKIDIVGGETMFYENIVKSITRSRSLDSFVNNSSTIKDAKTFLLSGGNGNGEDGDELGPIEKIRNLIGQFGLNTEDVKNLTISALLIKMSGLTNDRTIKNSLKNLMEAAESSGMDDIKIKSLGI